jgi:hypothetical protein
VRAFTVTHLQARIVRTMRCRLVRATTRMGGHVKVPLVNPHVPEVLHARRELTQNDLPNELTTQLDLVHRMLTEHAAH